MIEDYRLSPKEPDEISECLHCGGEIYQGHEAYKVERDWVHEDCFIHFAEEILNAELVTAEGDVYHGEDG